MRKKLDTIIGLLYLILEIIFVKIKYVN